MLVKNDVDVVRLDWDAAGGKNLQIVSRPQAFWMLVGFFEMERINLDLGGRRHRRVVLRQGDRFIVATYIQGWLTALVVLA